MSFSTSQRKEIEKEKKGVKKRKTEKKEKKRKEKKVVKLRIGWLAWGPKNKIVQIPF